MRGEQIRYTGHDMDVFEEQMRQGAPSWSAFDIRMMFQGYLERDFAAEGGDVETLTMFPNGLWLEMSAPS
jgi:hypothetical protein